MIFFKCFFRREELQKMFKKFDLDKDSHVTYEEARWVLHDFGFTDQQVMELMEIHDVNKDGRLQYQEFVHFWNNCGGNDSFTTYTTPKVTIVGASVIDSHDCDTADGTPLISKVQVTGLSTSSTKQIYSTQIPVCAPSLGLAATSNIISTSETLHEKLKTPVTVSETSADNVSPLMRSNVVLNLSRRHAECPNSFGKNGSTKLSRKMTVLQTSKRTATGKIELNTLTESAPASSEPNYVSQKWIMHLPTV